MPLILGGVGALAVVLVLVLMNSQSGGGDDAGGGGGATAPKQTTTQPAPRSGPRTELKMGAAKSGKTPDRPAPTLTQEMLQKAAGMVQEAKVLNNEGVKLRSAGDNRGARAKNSEAKRKLDEVKTLLDAALSWQEEADLEGWAMPREYSALGELYGQVAKLKKRVRMGGGK